MSGSFLIALAAAVVGPGANCAAARAALPQLAACEAQPGGIALASSKAAARDLLTRARTGEKRFQASFERAPSHYALFEFNEPTTVAATTATLRGLGFPIVLPLSSPGLRERRLADLMRSMPDGGEDTVVRLVTAAGSGEPRDDNTVPHELGHKWYSDAFWPASGQKMPAQIRRYGSPAPDWLDEAAAMLMEDASGTRGYFKRFADGRSRDAQTATLIPPEIPLAALTNMDHPALASLPGPSKGAGSGNILVTGRPTLFYAEVRVFADYLAIRSGDPRILAKISTGLQRGSSFDGWLSKNGSQHRLPKTLAAMQSDWDRWLKLRFGELREPQ